MSESMIPDGLSFSQLQEMIESACPEPDATNDEPQLTEREMKRIIAKAVDSVNEQFDGEVFGYKMLAFASLHLLFEFHNQTHAEACKNGDYDVALRWGRDAGWLQMCLNALRNVHCGPIDFLSDD